MPRWLPAVLVLVATACSERLPPPPELSGVSPSLGRVGVPVALTVDGRFPVRAYAEVGGRGRAGVDATYRAWLDDQELTDVSLSDGRTLLATVPEDIAPGVHDLTVADPYERRSVLVAAYEALLPATALAFTSAPQTVALGACSTALIVELRDATGKRATADVDLTITFTASATSTGFAFFADAACSGPQSSLLLPAGATSGQLYFRGTVPGRVSVTAAAPGLAPAVQGQTITLIPTQLVFTTLPQTVGAGTCSSSVGLGLEDAAGSPAAAPNDLQVDLVATGLSGFSLFSDRACATPTSSVTVPRGATSTDFTFRATTIGAARVTAAAAGFPTVAQMQTIVAGPPSRLAFQTAPQSVAAGTCSGTVGVQVQDAFGNPASMAAATPLALSSTSPTTDFFAGPVCGSPATTVYVSGNTATFTFRDSQPGTPTLTVSASGLDAATQVETIVGPDAGATDGGPDAGSSDAGVSDAGGPADSGSADAGGQQARFKTGPFFLSTTTGSQVIDHDLGVEPKALIIWTVGATSAGTNSVPHYRFAIGVSTGPDAGWTNAATSLDNASNGQDVGRLVAPAAISVVDKTGGANSATVVLAQAQLLGWDAGTFTLNWTTAGPALRAHFLILGGANVEASVGTWDAPLDAGTRAVTWMPFQPDVVLHFWVGDGYTTASTLARFACPGIGVMDADGGQWAVDSSANNSKPSRSARNQRTDATISMTDADPPDSGVLASFASMNPDGFTVNFSKVFGVPSLITSLGLRGVRAQACRFNKVPAGAQFIPGAFQPEAVILASFQAPTATWPELHGRLGLGMTDGTETASIAWNDASGVQPPQVQSIDSTALFTKMNGATPQTRAYLSSLDGGVNLTWSANDPEATEILCLMLGSR